LASSDKPPLGRASVLGIMARAAARLIEAYRSENGLRDLFGRNEGTVALTQIDGRDIFGSNSSSPTYTSTDRLDAENMRDRLIAKFPDDMKEALAGQMPTNAVFHAESNALMRASRELGGTLEGRDLVIVVDRPMCNNCDRVLPLIGRELGNPRVTFVAPSGSSKIMQDGRWYK
jgi:hypothetical protein